MSSLRFGVFLGLLMFANAVEAREWSSKNGQFKIEADAIAFSDHLVVLKKTNGALVAVELEQLSDADKKFLLRRRRQLMQPRRNSMSFRHGRAKTA